MCYGKRNGYKRKENYIKEALFAKSVLPFRTLLLLLRKYLLGHQIERSNKKEYTFKKLDDTRKLEIKD